MTQEEKAKAYDEAIERAKGIYDETIVPTPTAKGTCEYIFPELTETEGASIRKEIIEFISWAVDRGSITDFQRWKSAFWIAWLKKQDEQKQDVVVPRFRVGDVIRPKGSMAEYTIESISGGCYHGKGWGLFIDYDEDYELVEKNPADKVEPKFKVGDWVVYKNDICQIVKREEGCNKLVTVFGIIKELVNERNLSSARLWAIQDAKDGDVLVAKIDEEPNDFIYIFNGYNKVGFCSYCYLDAHTNKFHKGIYHNNLNVGVPATKEQRDLFFQKMKEAGYEWDAEKKELSKIRQKAIWSEEDENRFRDLVCLVEHSNLDKGTEEGFIKFINRLRTLK